MKQRFLHLKVIQIKYAIKLTTIHYAGECVPYSSQACINAGENLGLTPGNFDGNYGYHYAGEYGVKGCFEQKTFGIVISDEIIAKSKSGWSL